MLRVAFDLEELTLDELDEAEVKLHHDVEEARRHDPQLAHLFEALEQAVHEEAVFRHAIEEKHTIAQALGIDEETGEWEAGA